MPISPTWTKGDSAGSWPIQAKTNAKKMRFEPMPQCMLYTHLTIKIYFLMSCHHLSQQTKIFTDYFCAIIIA